MRAVTVALAACLVVGSAVAGWGLAAPPRTGTYHLDLEATEDGGGVAFEALDPAVQRAVRADLNGTDVALEEAPAIGSDYVRYEGTTYRVLVAHSDPAPDPVREAAPLLGSLVLLGGVLVGLRDRFRGDGHDHGHGGDGHDH